MVDLLVGKAIIDDVRVIIFDKDGTLIELYHYWSKMVELRARLICERLSLDNIHVKNISYEMGVDDNTGRLRPDGPVGLKKREIVMQAAIDYLAGLGYKETYNLCFNIFKEVDEFTSSDLKGFVKPISGAKELVRKASKNGCKIAVATTDRRERAGLAMNFIGIGDVVDMIVGADDVSRQKPDPEQVYMILNTFGIDRSHAVMVGDALTDVEMGINAGVKASIGLLTGFATYEQLMKTTPYVADDISKIEIITRDGDKP
ncbi:MAG: HAD family hydrolase [Proteobacteria bacterium]|nr:HAD family hydrolase [Pseudomonadota bacterium]